MFLIIDISMIYFFDSLQACDSSCSASALKALMLQLWQHQYIIYRLSGDPMRSEKPDLFATLRRTIVSFGWKEVCQPFLD
jgi:hypothetical protein